jgi:hypothetical protein
MALLARYDKYDGKSGGFRAKLNAAWSSADVKKVIGVSINGSGRIVKGGAATAIVGVVVIGEAKAAGDVVDVMTSGEIVDFFLLNDNSTATVAGTVYYADAATGDLTATATSNKRVGQLLETVDGVSRLIVRVVQ